MTGLTVNFGAHFHATGGLGRHVRSFAAALAEYARVIPFYFFPPPQDREYDGAILPRPARWDDTAPAICLASMDALRRIPGKRLIFYTMWETSRVPEVLLQHLDMADQIWLPTDWGRDVFVEAGIDAERLRVVPEGVDSSRFRPSPIPMSQQDEVFRFLCVGKWEVRKGIADLVQTFCREFQASEPVELILHVHNPFRPTLNIPQIVAQLCRQAGNPNARVVLSEPLPFVELIGLMQSCDAFVLPTRAEGWGLPILEAMACALPCIVTDYSGHRAFADHSNSFLINVKQMCPAIDPFAFPASVDWGEWAQPDLDHLAHLMRYVFENREQAQARGRIARRHAVERWSWDNAARIAIGHLNE